jgi:hypothetical protein
MKPDHIAKAFYSNRVPWRRAPRTPPTPQSRRTSERARKAIRLTWLWTKQSEPPGRGGRRPDELIIWRNCHIFEAGDRFAETKPTTTAGAAALVAYICADLADGETDWHAPAPENGGRSLNGHAARLISAFCAAVRSRCSGAESPAIEGGHK